ncbi:MAG: excinuclease ABC subunit UvrC [Deltaproteobacteria bacterium]|nr:excinuclease ABC subunit UvrC [Deltaproteobacteria bacterium]
MALPEVVERKLDALPVQPGVYVFLDRKGHVLYVGKARSLRSRVRSYFQEGSSDNRFFIHRLPYEIGDLQTFVVANEKEAALLENALIKEKRPRYNFKLRDDKEFLSIRIDLRDAWPKLTVVRKPKQDGAQYYGPYDSATAARKTLRLVNRHFKLRTCRDSDFARRIRPCLQYQIRRCPGPCVMEVDRDAYLAQASMVGLFLDGRQEELTADLDRRMRDAAKEQAFEQAAVYRDQLRAIDRVQTDQRIAVARDVDQDVLGMFVHGDRAELAMVIVRGGRMTNVRTFSLDAYLPDEELVASFVTAFYAQGNVVPDEILLPVEVEAMEGLALALSEERGRRCQVLVPQRGAKKDLVRMATENAEHAYREKEREKEDVDERLAEVEKKLRLPRPPRRIECVDISHLGGTDTVAAFTAMTDGQLDRARYRSFHLRGQHTNELKGGDDFGAMREVLTRRLARAGEPDWQVPDLLVVDGGRGQLGIALAVIEELARATDDEALAGQLRALPVAGLAKEKEQTAGKMVTERVFLPGQKNPIVLRERSATRHFLTQVRDEAHRVSNALREKVGKRRRLRSGIDDVPGVGEKTRKALLKSLGSLRAILAASEAELIAAGASSTQAAAIRAHFDPVRSAEPTTTSAESSAGAIDASKDDTQGEVDVEDAAVEAAFFDEVEVEVDVDEPAIDTTPETQPDVPLGDASASPDVTVSTSLAEPIDR